MKAIETDTWIHKIQKVSTEDKDIIYRMITLKSYGGFYHDVITKIVILFFIVKKWKIVS